MVVHPDPGSAGGFLPLKKRFSFPQSPACSLERVTATKKIQHNLLACLDTIYEQPFKNALHVNTLYHNNKLTVIGFASEANCINVFIFIFYMVPVFTFVVNWCYMHKLQ